VVGTLNATWNITGVQLEVGVTATSFDYRPYGTELALCQRYGLAVNGGYTGFANGTTVVDCGGSFPVTMRTAPTATAGTLIAQAFNGGGTAPTQSAAGITFPNNISQNGGTLRFSSFTGLTSGVTATITPSATTGLATTYYAFLSAEL
jgi:hypothetical protein